MSVRDAVPTDLQPVFDAAVDALSAADCHGPGIETMVLVALLTQRAYAGQTYAPHEDKDNFIPGIDFLRDI